MKRLKRRRRLAQGAELDITAFMNLMVILIPFLLITAVFSRITVLELSLPPAASEASTKQPTFDLSVSIFPGFVELKESGSRFVKRYKRTGNAIDWVVMNEHLRSLKARYPKESAATVLVEESIEYDMLVQVMDHVRVDSTNMKTIDFLFPDVAIGDVLSKGGI